MDSLYNKFVQLTLLLPGSRKVIKLNSKKDRAIIKVNRCQNNQQHSNNSYRQQMFKRLIHRILLPSNIGVTLKRKSATTKVISSHSYHPMTKLEKIDFSIQTNKGPQEKQLVPSLVKVYRLNPISLKLLKIPIMPRWLPPQIK